jgi:hypothetical protein
MSQIIFEAEISRHSSAPLILRFESLRRAARVLNVSPNTIAKALLAVRRVNGELSNTFIASSRSRYPGDLVKVKLLEGIPKIYIDKPDEVYQSSGLTPVYPTHPNISTAKSKYKLIFFEKGREVGRCCGVPQALRILIEHYPGDLSVFRDSQWEFRKATMRMRSILIKYGSVHLDLNDSTVTVKLET